MMMPTLFRVLVTPAIAISAPIKYICGFLFVLLLSSCSTNLSDSEAQQVQKALDDSLLATTETWGLDMDLVENGTKKIRLRGAFASSNNDSESGETRISGPVSVLVYDDSVQVKTRVTADSAIYHPDNTEFELFGNVRVNTSDNRHLESEYLRWQEVENEINTPLFVIITTPADSIAGTGFTGASDLSTYTIREPSGRVIFD